MGKELIFILCLVFSFCLVSAYELPVHQINTDIEIYQECFNCTYCNFTSFKHPNSTNLLTGMIAEKTDTHYSYLIKAGNITEQGTYRYCYNCGNEVDAETGCIDVPVNYTGTDLELPQTIMYITVLIFLTGLLGYVIYLYPKLPNHSKNPDGYVIDANSLAYLRPVAIGGMWILLLSITFIVANISIAYISAGFLGKFIFGLWKIMILSNLVILPIWVVYIINDIYRTAKLKEFIDRGGMQFG